MSLSWTRRLASVAIGACTVVVLLQVGACTPIVFSCQDDQSCGDAGICEVEGYCSFEDGTCPSGRRFGGHSGRLSSQCVGPEGSAPSADDPSDEQPDAPSDDDDADASTGGSDPGEAPTDDDPGADPSTTGGGSSAGDDSTTTAQPDASTGDGSSGGDFGSSSGSASPPPPPASCTDVFDPVTNSFALCDETPTSCRFFAQTGGGSCETLCQSAGATCLHAWNDGYGGQCRIDPSTDDCSAGLGTQICECSLP